jgi:predicted DNA-binding transcriptional regulator YafY
MTTPASRLITLIMLLQSRSNQKAAELAGKLGVSVRTLHRYFEMLDEMGIPIYSERGPQGGFSLVRGYKMPPLMFTPEEAVAVYLGTSLVGEMWGQLYREAAAGALAKLDNVLPDEQRGEVAWARRSLVATGMHRADPSLLATLLDQIRSGARQQRQVRIRYQGSTSDQSTERLVDPYALALRSGWWYLVGFCHLRQGWRTFRVDRIQELEQLSQKFQVMENFDARAHLEAWFKDQPAVRAHLRFEPEAAHIATSNIATWEALERNPDGSVEVTAVAPDLNWLAAMVLGFAGWVRVLEPPELREMVRERALATAALYEERNSSRPGTGRAPV